MLLFRGERLRRPSAASVASLFIDAPDIFGLLPICRQPSSCPTLSIPLDCTHQETVNTKQHLIQQLGTPRTVPTEDGITYESQSTSNHQQGDQGRRPHELQSSRSLLALFSSDVVITLAIGRYRSTPTQLHISHSGTRFKGAEVR